MNQAEQMQTGFNVECEFSFRTETDELTLRLFPVDENDDLEVEREKTIVLSNPNDIEKCKVEAMDLVKSMLPSGKGMQDYKPLMNQLKELLEKVKNEGLI